MKSEATNHLQVKFIKVNVIIYINISEIVCCVRTSCRLLSALSVHDLFLYISILRALCLTITVLPVMISVAI